MTETEPTTEAVASTLQEYLHVATGTGDLRGTYVEFTRDGTTWADVLLDEGPPAAARATVHRDGQAIPTVVTVVWGEALPLEGDWHALWLTKPHALLGAFVLRAALRRAFADVLGDRREPDEQGTAPEPTAPVAEPVSVEAAEGWVARVNVAEAIEDVDAVHAEARAAKHVTQELHAAVRRRRRELAAAEALSADAPAEPVTDPSAPKPTAPKSKHQTSVAAAYDEAQAARDEKRSRRATRGAGA